MHNNHVGRASQHKESPTNRGKGGHFHRQSHDTFVLDDWLDATRASVSLNKATVRQRSRVHDVCAKELLHQVSVGSPKIALMLGRVWHERSSLLEETLRKMEHQVQVRDFAQTELLNVARSAGVRSFFSSYNFHFVCSSSSFFLLLLLPLKMLFENEPKR